MFVVEIGYKVFCEVVGGIGIGLIIMFYYLFLDGDLCLLLVFFGLLDVVNMIFVVIGMCFFMFFIFFIGK